MSLGLHFGSSLYLHQYFKHTSSEGSGESARKCADSPEPSLLNNSISAKSHVLILHAKMVDFYNGVKLYLYWPRHHKTLLIQPKKNDLIFLA